LQGDKRERIVISFLKALRRALPDSAGKWINRVRRPRLAYLPFRRMKGPSRFGYDRGSPIDRHYIEEFLDANRQHIRGVTLEVKGDEYARRFGGSQVTHCDILDIDSTNPRATVVGDLRRLRAVPDDKYDTIILTQVLQYVDDLPSATAEVHRILKPGGTVLITVPFLMILDPRAEDYWRFTENSLRYLLRPHFPEANLLVESRGNLATAAGFMMGLAAEEFRQGQLRHRDPTYACNIGVRATKPDTFEAPAARSA
jgi:predicted SAM-dependent methyltransferase